MFFLQTINYKLLTLNQLLKIRKKLADYTGLPISLLFPLIQELIYIFNSSPKTDNYTNDKQYYCLFH